MAKRLNRREVNDGQGKIMRLEQTARFERLGQISEFTPTSAILWRWASITINQFSREVVDAALPTLKYLPIVAYLYDGEDGKASRA
ncbi:MAG: hypothetical protein ACLVJ6_10700 [Merdibacter sp.]